MSSLLENKKILMISFTSFLQEFYQTLPNEIAIQSGADVDILVPPYWKEMWSKKVNRLEKKKERAFNLHVGDIAFVGNLHFSYFKSELKRLIKELQPDIVDLENEPFNAGTYQVIRSIKKYSPHSIFVTRASQNVYKSYPFPFNYFEKSAIKNAKAILVRNSDAKNVLIKKGYSGIIEQITHGVDTDFFNPDNNSELCSEFTEGKPLIGFVGSFEVHKGLDYLIKASVGKEWQLLFIGDGSQSESLQNLARELKVDLIIKQSLTHEQVAKFMSCFDLFVLPSITTKNWTEKFGRVLIEAMASGNVVLGSDSGEISKVIGDAGVIFKERNETDLREKIEMVLSNPTMIADLQIRSRERAVNKYSWKEIAKSTINIYEQLLHR